MREKGLEPDPAMLPADGEEQPEPDMLDLLYWEAFTDLSTDRPPSFGGLTQIPWSAIDRYAERNGFEGSMRNTLFHVIRSLDREIIKEETEKQKQKEKQQKAKKR